MVDLIDAYISTDGGFDALDSFDEQKIMLSAMKTVFPIIIEKELTSKQNICLKLYCIHHKSQKEIAEQLKLSQPTVCRHIQTAKEIINKYLNYCYFAVKKSNEQWLKIY
ncbi:MAG: hypothetical protein NC213_08775 [Acetobacter sp.]|nr:hypothetical protein [Bacteroides sp.]MCM1341822.1 hypothetical protein [Acetobacter sp.]MCM1433988.1 hypothetical protein [Clostridiales bacterium]